MQRAIALLQQTLQRDPLYGFALALLAMCYQNSHVNGWSQNQELDRRQGVQYARPALQAAEDDPDVLGNVAYVLGYFEPDIGPAIALVDRSLELNPSFALGWLRSGWLRLWDGQTELAIKHFEKSLRLNPRRRGPATFGIGVGYFFERHLEKAASMLLLSVEETPNWAPVYRFLASCYAHMGRFREAQDFVKSVQKLTPVLIPSAEHWCIPKDREYFQAGLRRAAQ